jgi:hypothetical protein
MHTPSVLRSLAVPDNERTLTRVSEICTYNWAQPSTQVRPVVGGASAQTAPVAAASADVPAQLTLSDRLKLLKVRFALYLLALVVRRWGTFSESGPKVLFHSSARNRVNKS